MPLGSGNPYSTTSGTGGMSAGLPNAQYGNAVPVMEPGGGYQGSLPSPTASSSGSGPYGASNPAPLYGSNNPAPQAGGDHTGGWIASAYNQSDQAARNNIANWFVGQSPDLQARVHRWNQKSPQQIMNKWGRVQGTDHPLAQFVSQFYPMLSPNMQQAWQNSIMENRGNTGGMGVGGVRRPQGPSGYSTLSNKVGPSRGLLQGQLAPYPFNQVLTQPNQGVGGIPGYNGYAIAGVPGAPAGAQMIGGT